ncbi:hypothetical protein L1887_23357 [Cichorium endivia]|nr:hypothetical protein L1887_23357 [Cichorium endivia]
MGYSSATEILNKVPYLPLKDPTGILRCLIHIPLYAHLLHRARAHRLRRCCIDSVWYDVRGELPAGAFFNTISPSSVAENPTLCGAAVNKSCPAIFPKPIVLNPNSTETDPDSIPPTLTHKRILLSVSALIAIGAAAFIVIRIILITVLNLRVDEVFLVVDLKKLLAGSCTTRKETAFSTFINHTPFNPDS